MARSGLSSGRTWGMLAGERGLDFPCDRFLPEFDDAWFRGISVRARPETVFRWLCQMRVAPYSYDWIDNFGRKSPRRLTPGLDPPVVGRRFMIIFELAAFERARHVTLRLVDGWSRKLFGELAVSYVIFPVDGTVCRLLAKLVIRYPAGPTELPVRWFLPMGDLIMMRRQLMNFRDLSEDADRRAGRAPRT